jgi:FkbM family methyltransferase
MYYSQIGQDKWVHSVLGDINGYFIELGACDGLHLSNTLFFERHLNWNGICIEPNDKYMEDLNKNRKCNISNDLIYSHEGQQINFAVDGSASSIIDQHIGPFTNTNVNVLKISNTLENVLDKFNSPKVIDYLSLDVEGQEYTILSTFPFDKYKFKCITVEHNAPHIGTQQQMLIRDVLENNGYTFVKGNDDVNNWGHGPIDDFYILKEFVSLP